LIISASGILDHPLFADDENGMRGKDSFQTVTMKQSPDVIATDQAPPNDGLREAIRSISVIASAAKQSMVHPQEDGLLRCARNEGKLHGRSLAARTRPKLCMLDFPPKEKGRGECRVLDAPAVSRAKWKVSTRGSHRGFTGFTRHSRTQWF
jgi:hypothetical protein